MITVVLPTRNPDRERLDRSLQGLVVQALPRDDWELVVVDNGSAPAVADGKFPQMGCPIRVVREHRVGLTPARLAGIHAARGQVIVFVDDDNVLRSDYLAQVARLFDGRPKLGAAGGPVIPEWEAPPPAWTHEFHGLLALRDLGPAIQIAPGGPNVPWPNFAPVGAGMAIRREFAQAYAAAVIKDTRRKRLDRSGSSLASGGDNDLVFTTLHAGGDVGYFPDLQLTHLIPAGRLEPKYLGMLNRGIMRTWVQVLALHGQCPWPAIASRSVALRATRAYLRARAWRGPAERVRWAGMLGQFEGQAELSRTPRQYTGYLAHH